MGKITVVGLGPYDTNLITVETLNTLKNKNVFYRTKIHPAVLSLEKQGMLINSFDHYYEDSETFEEVYEHIVDDLLDSAKDRDIVYAVPGNPCVAESTVTLLLNKAQEEGIDVQILPSVSFVDTVIRALSKDLFEDLRIVDAFRIADQTIHLDGQDPVLIHQVYDNRMLSEVKLRLLETYPDDAEAFLITGSGSRNEKVKKIKLYELDRNETNHLTSLFIPALEEPYFSFEELVDITNILRSPGGCPWDREQTHESLKRYLLEEAAEVIDAIDEGKPEHLQEELGDLLFQVMIHSQIANEDGEFSIYDVIAGINEKMIRRHPHVFATTEVDSSEEVLVNWDKIKQEEKKTEQTLSEEMEAYPKSLTALLRSDKIQYKARKAGFDWDDPLLALEKVVEETQEVKEELNKDEKDQDRIVDEIGDLFFAAVNLARLADVNPEDALNKANKKFINRFKIMEKLADQEGNKFEDLPLDEQEKLWEKAKLTV